MPLTLRVFGTRAHTLAGRVAHTFGPEGGRIGRARDNDWVLPDPERYVSSHHARIVVVDGRYNLLDTSSNGTYINGAAEALGRHGAHILQHGDELAIGGYEVRAEFGEQRADDVDSALLTAPPLIDPAASIPDLGAALDLSGLMRRPPISVDASPPAAVTPAVPMAAVALSTIHAFHRAAGLATVSLDSAQAQRLLSLAGLLLRELTTGLVAIARERRTRVEDAASNATGRFDLRLDPIGQAGSVDDALHLLLGEQRRRVVPPVESVRNAFSLLEAERRTVLDAARLAAATVLLRMDPTALEQRFGADANDAAAAHCWRQFRALHAKLIASDGLPTTWQADYETALQQLTKSRE